MIAAMTVLTGGLLAAEEGGHEIVNELPMSPLAFGLTSAAVFLVLLLGTVAFRSIGHRRSERAYASRGGHH
jgi:hypothetical protein